MVKNGMAGLGGQQFNELLVFRFKDFQRVFLNDEFIKSLCVSGFKLVFKQVGCFFIFCKIIVLVF